MPLNKLDNFIKNTEGRILYVSPSDLDSTDSITNQGNSLARPFKTIQRALLEAARFSYLRGDDNDVTEKTTILLMPGEHEVDNRPGYIISGSGPTVTPQGGQSVRPIPLTLNSNFDLTQEANDLVKFNSIKGGVIIPRGTSIVGLDLRKTKIRAKYIPNPLDTTVESSAIFRVTGACYLWQFSIFDGYGDVYTQPNSSSTTTATFSHHKLTVFEYADGVNEQDGTGLTDLQMYYGKLSIAYGTGSAREIKNPYPDLNSFAPLRPEFEIVGAFGADPIQVDTIKSGDGVTPTNVITVQTTTPHGLNAGTPIRISGVGGSTPQVYNISTVVVETDENNDKIFTYQVSDSPSGIQPSPPKNGSEKITIETDTVSGASPYIFNISLRSVWGMNGMHADGSKATGFRSMVVAQFTGVSLQKDDRAFVKYNPTSRNYSDALSIANAQGSDLSKGSSSSGTVYHLDSEAIYRKGWETTHIKITNDAILQIVSVFAIGYNKHFSAESGGDASITNSNSNFGQLSLISDGFKKEAFEKDNKAFITHVIPPRSIVQTEEPIDWLSINLSLANTTSKLYLNGFNTESIKPPVLTQGYRVGAKVSDRLFLTVGGVEKSAGILMTNATAESSFRQVNVTNVNASTNTFTSNGHGFSNREKVIITSDDADLPENLSTNTVYFVTGTTNNTFKLAASEAESVTGEEISVSGGTNLKVISRVSDKEAGDVSHPVQWDSVVGNWYINVSPTGNTIGAISGTGASEPTFLKRIEDTRSLDEKIYKVRVVVPNQFRGAKTPESGFILQESSTTGFRTDADATRSSISITNPSFGSNGDYDFDRNSRFISTCSRSSNTVTVVAELPHNLNVGDSIRIRNVHDSTITGVGTFNKGYNGDYTVSEVTDAMTFKYVTSETPGNFENDTSTRTVAELPRFERNDLQTNIYVYRNEIISEYDETNRNGVYHTYLLNASNKVTEEFTDLEYSQNVTDLYPQLDRDNIDDNPLPARTFASRSPLGDVSTNDLKKSVTRESADKLLTNLGIGLTISSVSSNLTSANISFERDHGLAGIVTYTTLNGGSNYTTGTYNNVKLLSGGNTGTWRGATANVVVDGSGAVSSAEIVSGGSNNDATEGLFFDSTRIGVGGNDARFNIGASGCEVAVGNVIQFTGSTTTPDTYHRISSVNSTTQISIAKTSGDTTITGDQYAIVIGPSIAISGAVGDVITTSSAHGLVVGNKVRIIDSSNNNVGDFIIANKTLTTVTITGFSAATTSGYILKHGMSSNNAVSDSTGENLDVRGFTVFDNDTATLTQSGNINDSLTTFSISNSGIGTANRFPIGSYIQIDNEIMRVASSTFSGSNSDQITVERGVLATTASSHNTNSLIRKVRIPSIELRRPSILRASGHTFEYLGYGPGNYSTALPQVQEITLTEREEFLSQSQERASGLVVYSGMNNRGDFFIGNQKKSSATGEETTFDTPIPTVTGENPARLSVVFDEVTVKERLVVEGGKSNQILSQFDGPVNFNSDIKVDGTAKFTSTIKFTDTQNNIFKDPNTGAIQIDGGLGVDKNVSIGSSLHVATNLEVSGNTPSTNTTSGSLVVTGGAGISENLHVGGALSVGGNSTLTGDVTMVGNLDLGDNDKIRLGDSDDLEIYHDGSDSYISDNGTGPLRFISNGGGGYGAFLFSATGGRINMRVYGTDGGTSGVGVGLYYNGSSSTSDAATGKRLETNNDGVEVTGNLRVTQDIIAFVSDDRLKTNKVGLTNALDKVNSLNGFTYNFNETAGALGFSTTTSEVGVSAQEVQAVLPEVIKEAPVGNEYITVSYHKLVPLLIEAIKELSGKVDVLEQKLSDK